MKLGELFFDLGIKSGGGAATLRDFMGKVGGLRLSTVSAAGAIGALGSAMAGAVSESASAAVAFQTFTNATSLSWRELQKWQLVGERANVPTEAMTAAVTKLQSKLIQLQLRGEGAGLFNLLGVEPGRATETFHVMEKLMGAYKRMPGGMFANVAAGLGLDPVLTNLFAKGPGWFQSQVSEVGGLGMTEAQQTKALGFMLEYRGLWQEIKALSFEVGENIMPWAEKAVKGLTSMVHGARESDFFTLPPAADPKNRRFDESLFYKWFINAHPMPLAPMATAPAGARGTVDVKISGDASDAAFARRVADEVGKMIGTTEAQVSYPEAIDPNAEFVIPPAR